MNRFVSVNYISSNPSKDWSVLSSNACYCPTYFRPLRHLFVQRINSEDGIWSHAMIWHLPVKTNWEAKSNLFFLYKLRTSKTFGFMENWLWFAFVLKRWFCAISRWYKFYVWPIFYQPIPWTSCVVTGFCWSSVGTGYEYIHIQHLTALWACHFVDELYLFLFPCSSSTLPSQFKFRNYQVL